MNTIEVTKLTIFGHRYNFCSLKQPAMCNRMHHCSTSFLCDQTRAVTVECDNNSYSITMESSVRPSECFTPISSGLKNMLASCNAVHLQTLHQRSAERLLRAEHDQLAAVRGPRRALPRGLRPGRAEQGETLLRRPRALQSP